MHTKEELADILLSVDEKTADEVLTALELTSRKLEVIEEVIRKNPGLSQQTRDMVVSRALEELDPVARKLADKLCG